MKRWIASITILLIVAVFINATPVGALAADDLIISTWALKRYRVSSDFVPNLYNDYGEPQGLHCAITREQLSEWYGFCRIATL